MTAKMIQRDSAKLSYADAQNMLMMDEQQEKPYKTSMALYSAKAPAPSGGAPQPSIHGGQGSYSSPGSPSPNQGKPKRKRFSNHGGYGTPPATSSSPWTGVVQAWPVQLTASPRPGAAPGILGARPVTAPQAYTAYAPIQYSSGMFSPGMYAAPPSVMQVFQPPPPMPAFGSTSTMPPQQLPPPPQQGPSGDQQQQQYFHETALNAALRDLSINGAWVADSGASAHMTANQGILLRSRPAHSFPLVTVGNGSSL
jgi:hypothetical protein